MSATTEHIDTPIVEEGSNALLYGLGTAMIVVVLLACLLIVEASVATLLVAVGGLVVVLCGVAYFIVKFIGDDDAAH